MPKSTNQTSSSIAADATGKAKPFPFPTAEHHPTNLEQPLPPVVSDPSEEAIDSGIEESFPASDPVSVTVTKAVPKADNGPDGKR